MTNIIVFYLNNCLKYSNLGLYKNMTFLEFSKKIKCMLQLLIFNFVDNYYIYIA